MFMGLCCSLTTARQCRAGVNELLLATLLGFGLVDVDCVALTTLIPCLNCEFDLLNTKVRCLDELIAVGTFNATDFNDFHEIGDGTTLRLPRAVATMEGRTNASGDSRFHDTSRHLTLMLVLSLVVLGGSTINCVEVLYGLRPSVDNV